MKTYDLGTLHGTPVTARTVSMGTALLLDADRRSCWTGAGQKTLLDDLDHVRAVLAQGGYTLMGDNTTVVRVPDAPPAPDANMVTPTPPLPEIALLDVPPIPPHLSAVVGALAEALPKLHHDVLKCPLTVNRHAVAWTVWTWMEANREIVTGLLAPPPVVQHGAQHGRHRGRR